MTLDQKTVIVTGAGGGIGRATSLVLAAAGAQVIVSDIAEEAANATVAAARAQGHRASFFRADLSKEADVQALVGYAVSQFGKLDGAFNNAGLEQCAKPPSNGNVPSGST